MIKIGDNPRLLADLDGEIGRLEALLADLRRLRVGTYPTAEELASATVILNPIEMATAAPVYVGHAVAHPERGSAAVRTSVVEVSGDGWFRSSNRLYRIERVEGVA